jgi:Plasmid maintenance system killer protein
MVIQFGKEYLKQLYYDGKSSDKTRRFQPQVVKGYVKCVKLLERVRMIEDLFPFHGLNYEVLRGEKKGLSSVRINNQYRLEFEVATDKETDETIIRICRLIDITNHYR